MRCLLLVLLLAGCTAKADKTEHSGCDLAGHYRLRFEAGVGQKLWFRFKVDSSGQTATMTKPNAMTVEKVKLDPDPAACKLSLTATTPRGEVLAQATLDPKTNMVTGTLRISGDREGAALSGFRDQGPPAGKHAACMTPGVYELVVPAEQAWDSDTEGVSCDEATLRIAFLVEPFGDDLAIDQLDADGTAAWGAEDVFEVGPCALEVRFRHHDQTAYTRLAFAADKVTATAMQASMRVVSKSGDVGRCIIDSPMAWVERRPE
ncbi:MAG: hypothetical protein H0T42_31935 [Deltaproteobacteria bacterium]|nr:hypothetical protein [Deltaproteobacteria bacterium]